MTFTARDLRDQIIRATRDGSDGEYDVDAIVEAIQEQYGTVDIETIDTDAFWDLVGKHATDWHPGYGQGHATTVHRTREDGTAYCGAETTTVGDRDSAMDLIQNHGYNTCISCSAVMSDAGVQA